jgi:hypothetical protein
MNRLWKVSVWKKNRRKARPNKKKKQSGAIDSNGWRSVCYLCISLLADTHVGGSSRIVDPWYQEHTNWIGLKEYTTIAGSKRSSEITPNASIRCWIWSLGM